MQKRGGGAWRCDPGSAVGGGTNASTYTDIAGPRGTISGAQVWGGAILEAEAGGGIVTHAYTGTTGPRKVITGVELMVGGVHSQRSRHWVLCTSLIALL